LDEVAWNNTRIVRDIDEIRTMKQQPGKDMHAVGGATLIGSLMNQRLINELRLVVNPILPAGAKALFKDVKERHALKLVEAEPLNSGMVRLTYNTVFAMTPNLCIATRLPGRLKLDIKAHKKT
jgi:dihydrofolate reductase